MGVSLSKAHSQSGFSYSNRRMQRDHNPMIRRKQLDFVCFWTQTLDWVIENYRRQKHCGPRPAVQNSLAAHASAQPRVELKRRPIKSIVETAVVQQR
jgi:hypothetical protein